MQDERQPRAATVSQDDDDLAEVEAGARPEDLGGEASLLQQLLSTQTKLLKKAREPQRGPDYSGARRAQQLDRVRDGIGKRTYGSRGYVKLMQQQPAQVTNAIRSAAALEMSSLMRSYVERKMVIGEHRQLALFSYFLAHAWEAPRDNGNEEMEFWMSRGLLMADQFGEQQPAAFLTLDILVGKRAQIGFARLLKVVETSKSLPLHQCDWMCAWCREGLPLLSPWQFEKGLRQT